VVSEVQDKARYNYFLQFGVEPERHDVEAILRALCGDRVEHDLSSDTGEVDPEQVREDGASVDPRHEWIAVTLDASRLVVEDLTTSERASKHVWVALQQRDQSVHDDIDSIHHQRHVYLHSSNQAINPGF